MPFCFRASPRGLVAPMPGRCHLSGGVGRRARLLCEQESEYDNRKNGRGEDNPGQVNPKRALHGHRPSFPVAIAVDSILAFIGCEQDVFTPPLHAAQLHLLVCVHGYEFAAVRVALRYASRMPLSRTVLSARCSAHPTRSFLSSGLSSR